MNPKKNIHLIPKKLPQTARPNSGISSAYPGRETATLSSSAGG